MSQYDERLLASAPAATRAEKQEGYNVDLLEGPRNTTSGKSSPPTLPSTAPLAPNVDQAENGLGKEVVYNKYDTPTPWYKTKKGIIILVVIAIVIVAAVIGGAVGGTVNKHNNNASQSTGEGQATPQGGSQGGQGGQAAAPSSSSHSVAASASASASVDPGANSGNGGGGPLAPSISKAILLGAPAPTSL